jgi:hypothetical protein
MTRPVTTWRGVGVQSLAELRRKNRHLDRRRAHVSKILTMLQRGQALYLQHDRRRGRLWSLTDGTPVNDEVAQLLITRPDVVAAGDTLLCGTLSQVYRFISKED